MWFPNPFKVVADILLIIPRSIAEQREEQRRLIEREVQRIETPPCYEDGIDKHQFEAIVEAARAELPRIEAATVRGFVINIKVKSISGISVWSATVDFNDYGHLTGWYKIKSENNESKIPVAFAREVNKRIHECKAAAN